MIDLLWATLTKKETMNTENKDLERSLEKLKSNFDRPEVCNFCSRYKDPRNYYKKILGDAREILYKLLQHRDIIEIDAMCSYAFDNNILLGGHLLGHTSILERLGVIKIPPDIKGIGCYILTIRGVLVLSLVKSFVTCIEVLEDINEKKVKDED